MKDKEIPKEHIVAVINTIIKHFKDSDRKRINKRELIQTLARLSINISNSEEPFIIE